MKVLIAIALLLGVLVVGPLSLLAASDDYNSCVANNGAYTETPKSYEDEPFVHGPIINPTGWRLFLHCGGAYTSVNADAIMALFTALLTVITVGLGWIALEQGSTTRAQLRAYVSANAKCSKSTEPNPFVISITNTRNWVAHFVMSNVGQTPAFKVDGLGYLDVLPEPLPDGFKIKYPDSTLIRGNIVLFPNQKADMVAMTTAPFSQQQIADIQRDDSGKALYAFGTISYWDTFGYKHKTRYCVVVEQQYMRKAIASATDGKMSVLSLSSTGIHNDAT
jgi:hypothetical protein